MSVDRLKVLLYQYLLFRGDVYEQKANDSLMKLHKPYNLTSSDFDEIRRDLIVREVFNAIQWDLFDLLNYYE